MKKERLKRGYFVYIKDEGIGEAVIATSNQEAKKLAWPGLCLDGEWIDLRARAVVGNEQENECNMEKGKKKSAILPIAASHTELVTDEKTDRELKEFIKKLKRLE